MVLSTRRKTTLPFANFYENFQPQRTRVCMFSSLVWEMCRVGLLQILGFSKYESWDSQRHRNRQVVEFQSGS